MVDKIRSETDPQEPKQSPAAEGDRCVPRVSTKMFGKHSLLQITLDNETVARLREPNQHAHVRDEQGNIVGVFKALPLSDAATYQHALETVDFDQLQRASDSSRPGYTIEQIRAHLRKLEQEEAACASR